MPGELADSRFAPAACPSARRHARVVLVSAGVVAALLVGVTVSPMAEGDVRRARGGQGDVALYAAEVARIRAGEGYYESAAAELRDRGYPTRSVFNWRTPLPMWLLGRLPHDALGATALGLLAGAVILLSVEALSREQPGRIGPALGCGVLLVGPLVFCVLDRLHVMPVLWAGTLIALSLACYGVGRPGWGVVCGVAAVFFRELALPYAALSAGMAAWEGRRRECAGWLVGLVLWALAYGWHVHRVLGLITPDATAHPHGWLRFGGAPFVVAAAQVNAILFLLPQWATALYLTAALLGMAGWSTPLGRRVGLTTCLFVGLFAFVGQEFNQYWGCLIGPLLCFGVAHCPGQLRALLGDAGLTPRGKALNPAA